MPYYSQENLEKMHEVLVTVGKRADELMLKYTHHPFGNAQAREYASQGYARRVQLLRQCLDNIFRLLPPETSHVPKRAVLKDTEINIHAFFANAYGSVDDLAWVWVYESGLHESIDKRRVGLRSNHVQVRESLGVEFSEYLDGLNKWFGYVVEYRDALAHRIPPYIPPGNVPPTKVDEYNNLSERISLALSEMDVVAFDSLTREQNGLLVFQPFIAHSITETNAIFAFHWQLLTDFLTIEEIGTKLMDRIRGE